MPLSRLENFLKNAEGNILYVNPSDFDATDSFENRGNSLTRPFKTIQRAVLEAARFSYLSGKNNDKIDNTTILVYPGTHYIDNRPGYSITNQGGTAQIKRLFNGSWTTSGASISEISSLSNFQIFDEDNDLYKLNSVHGGVILPRGTSIVGLDLRKTKIRPLYVPDPLNDLIEPTSIFKVTGTCYFTSFTIFDADPLRAIYKDSTVIKAAPNFSHHKLSVFEYADGINDVILGSEITTITDLDMYYAKVSLAYGDSSGRGLINFPSVNQDFETSVDEYRIVGDLRADSIGITSIRSGNGVVATPTVTVITESPHGLFKDTPILISGITTSFESYTGSFIVSNIENDFQFTYTSPTTPVNPLPTPAQIVNAQVIVESDSVSSASPYIFSCTLRSVYGLNGMWADGNKATGFKSMLTAQFTGISLQKDDNAFILYDPDTGIYNNNESVNNSEKPLHINSRSIYRPGWESTHIKVTNNAIIQAVSVFAIGFARHFVAESGGDMSITNSNSNFGAVSLESTGFRPESFDRDDVGYITHIIPPREPSPRVSNVSWLALDVEKIVSTGVTSKLWIADYKSSDLVPPYQIDSYRVGAKKGEELFLSVNIGAGENTYSTPVLMQVPSETYTGAASTSSNKEYYVGRNAGINSIFGNILTLTENHKFFNGEKVRIYSDTGETPNNVTAEKIYYVYTTGLNPNQVKLSSTLNDTKIGNTIIGISNSGGILKVISSVSDKAPGEFGHPIQYDSQQGQWYIIGSGSSVLNTIYSGIVAIGTAVLGNTSGTTFIKRTIDNRGLEDRLYKFRYVIPKEFTNSRPPTDGFVVQESKTVGIGSLTFLTSTLGDSTQLRNPRLIAGAEYSLGTAVIRTELPHNLVSGDVVKISNVVSSNNLTGDNSLPYNGTFTVDSTPNSRTFTYTGLTSNPGTFLSNTNARSTNQQVDALPTFQRDSYNETLFIYRNQELKQLIPGTDGQDGIYNFTGVLGSIKPDSSVGFGISEKRFNQDIKNLYPQQDRDNYKADPEPTISYAELSPIGKVSTNDRRNSLTKEALNAFLLNNRVGLAITGVTITGTGNTTLTLYTNVEHGLNSIKSVTIINGGAGYNNSVGSTTLYSAELINTTISGRNASVRAQVSSGSTVSEITIVDPGSCYGVGNTMTISASPAGTPIVSAVVQVTSINDNTNDAIELNGFIDPKYNGTFKILSVPSAKTIEIFNPNGISGVYTGRTNGSYPIAYPSAKGIGITTMVYTPSTGIVTVTSLGAHGLLVGNTFNITGLGSTSYFNSRYNVSEVPGITTFTFNAGISTLNRTITLNNNVIILKSIFSSNDKSLGSGEENLGGRGNYIYAGITTTLSGSVTTTDTTFTFTSSTGFRKGDYVAIGAELLRLASNPTSNSFEVIRGQFSTQVEAYVTGTQIKKVRVIPVELRRPSILRASGHTFEYLGFGPGNYSTALPVKQDRILTDDEILVAQAREQNGGTVVYTGMNDKGEFYSGATKINGATGEEEIIEAPVVSFFGDDAQAATAEKRNSGIFDDLVVKERMTVEGGENNNQTSQFYGPVNFSQKVTSSSEDGLETRDLYIKGVASQPKLITVGIATPAGTKKAGDIDLLSNPSSGGYLGHIFADGEWRRFGMISKEKDADFLTLDRIGIGQSESIYNFTDALEVNGSVKVKNLYVGGAVTFAGGQAIGNASFEVISVDKTVKFTGSGGTSYSIITTDVTDIAQFGNMEVTGYAVTFTTPTVRFQNSFNSVHSGVSTVAGTLNVATLTCVGSGFGTFRELLTDKQNTNTLAINTSFTARSGIITFLNVPATPNAWANGTTGVGTIDRLVGSISTITNMTGTAATITNFNSTTAFITNLRASTTFATPDAKINTGIITNLSASVGVITNLYSNVGVITALVIPSVGYQGSLVDGWIGAPTAYINVGIVTTAQINVLHGQNGQNLTAYINTGIVTNLNGSSSGASGGTLKYLNGQFGGNLWLSGSSGQGIFANSGIITNFGLNGSSAMFINCGNGAVGNPVGVVTAGIFVSRVSTGTAPINVTSTTLNTNLNANFVGGYNSSRLVKLANNIWNVSDDAENRLYFTTSGKTIYGAPDGGHEFRGSANTAIFSIDNDGNVSATGEITASSDERIKTNIKTIDNALDKVTQLRGVEYDRTDIKSHQLGVIAQEVESILPDLVRTDERGMKSVAYGNLTAVLIEAIKELKGEISELKQKVTDLESNK
jgi:hypothetical protein